MLLITIFFKEVIRFIVSNHSKKQIGPYIYLTVILISFDIYTAVLGSTFATAYQVFAFLCVSILPSIARNILSSYITYEISYTPSFIFNAAFTLAPYVLPIFPDLGDYINCVLGILFPLIIYLTLQKWAHYQEKKAIRLTGHVLRWFGIPICLFAIVLVVLVSGVFSYQMIAIGSYSYYLKVIVTANQTNSDSNYFTREYTLSEPKEQSFQNIRQLNINDSIDVSYDTYNELLIDFKEEFGVSMDGNLEVVLVVRNMVNHELEERTILKESNLGLNIPLTTLTMEVPIESDSQNSTGELVSYEITKEGWFYPVARVLSILSYIASFLSIIYLIVLCYQSYRMESKYHKELKRILKVYDGVIVNLKNMPNVEVEKLLPVLSFEELIDAHSEVRNPINYIQKRDGAIFLLMSNGYYYYYKLKRELFTLPKEVEHEKVD